MVAVIATPLTNANFSSKPSGEKMNTDFDKAKMVNLVGRIHP